MKKQIQSITVSLAAFIAASIYSPSVLANGLELHPAGAVQIERYVGPEGSEAPVAPRPAPSRQQGLLFRINDTVAPAAPVEVAPRNIVRLQIGTPQFARYTMDPAALPSWDANQAMTFTDISTQWRYVDPDFAEGELMASPLDNPLYASYNVIVIVNRTEIAATETTAMERAQTVRVYDRSLYPISNGLRYYWKTSTGTRGHPTPGGHFRPNAFSSDYHSMTYPQSYDEATNTETWGGAGMKFATFFAPGIALHDTDDVNYRRMGTTPQSHGCVRLVEERAVALFHLVGHSGYDTALPQFNRSTGEHLLDREGQVRTTAGYKTLIIVR